ncbi:hypothetical protein [Flavobacterium urumqiense]|uniref:Uncharacterized protein n=1 Tax=Flavobacterium urumqiense TaxID=935224 RepID=A0A1H6A0U3_9FLAO|nr:hypothetical protein [Flavobacterium urumqiense]SEG42339.1 hypothetical protein SAMN04488130_1132 [Flavobacterium urumqiense]
MDIFFVQITFGVVLFFLINWIGKHSYSIGYRGISIFVKAEEAPALNFLIRVLTPIVYLIIISSALYYFNLDKYVTNIYLVNIYYIIFRLLFNLVTSRGKLLDWYRQALYWSTIIIISYFVYDKIIRIKENILPDFTTIANELWIIILIFIFQLTNNIRFSQDGTVRRKENYLKSRYRHFNNLYGELIKDITKNEALESVAYSILIYEDFNRPKVIRLIENIKHRFSDKSHTLGVMQVKSDKLINDRESIMLGTTKIVNSCDRYIKENSVDGEKVYEWNVINSIIADYNVGSEYLYEVNELSYEIRKIFYPNSKDSLGFVE